MSNEQRYPTTPFDIGLRLKLILKNFGLEQAENYFTKIPESRRNYQIYLALLNCYTVSKSVEKAESIMLKARDLKYADKPIWYNLMMNMYYQLGNREKMGELLSEMESNSISYDHFTYSICLSACAMASDSVGMDRVVRIMESDPSVIVHWRTLVTAAQGYIKIGSIDEAMEVLRKLEKQMKISPHKYVLLAFLLNLYAEAGKKEEIYRIWKATKDGKVVNKVYISMMRSLMKFNDIEGMEKVFEEWESGASLFDFRVPNFLIDAYCNDGCMEKAETLIAKVVSKGGIPIVTTWCYMAGGYITKNQVDKAVRSLRKAISVCPSKFTSQKHSLITCLECLQNNENVEEVKEMIKSFRMKGVSKAPASDECCSFTKDSGEDQDSLDILDEDVND